MKLPKNFGGRGFSAMLAQAQQAMARAQDLEQELAQERIAVDKGPVKALFSGTGEIQTVKIDPAILDPNEVEALEDLIVSAIRDGFQQATALRNDRVQAILPNIPGL
jgi:DNA-binding YbaB/EbfC family protein